MIRTHSILVIVICGAVAALMAATAQDTLAETPRTVQFARRPAEIGDRVVQDMRFRLTMKTTVHRDGQPVEMQSTELARRQRRNITARGIEAGRVVRAEVTFEQADQSFGDGKQPLKPLAQPVAGKTYLVARENDVLTITDRAGRIPPMEEFEIVMQSMEAIGQPNPLAEFLAGRRVTVGQTLSMPKEIAGSLLGVTEQGGRVTRFDLTLREVLTLPSGQLAAVFAVRIDVHSASHTQMGMQIDGQLVLETTTCRTVQAKLTGPIGLAESQSIAGTQSLITGRGRITIATTSRYMDKR